MMMDFILNYMGKIGISAVTAAEQEQLEKGISLYMLENGIEENETGKYYKKYVIRRLNKIASQDLKLYFMHYPAISEVRQIVIEYLAYGTITDGRRKEYRRAMEELYQCGLGEKYVP